MTDWCAERAMDIILDVDTTYSYAQIPPILRPLLQKHITAALTQAVARETERCAGIAEGDQSAMPMDSSDIDCGLGLAKISVGSEFDDERIERIGMTLAEFRAVTRQEERKAIAASLRKTLTERTVP